MSRAVLIASSVGLAIRLCVILLSPRWEYYQDHDDLARWGLQCVERGVLTVYDHPPDSADLRVWTGEGWEVGRRELNRLCNYPPLCVYLLAGSGAMFKATSPDRIINTIYSRASIGLWSVLFDFLLAAGCAKLVSHYRPGRYGLWAYVVCILAPPFWLVSCLWGQVDTWVLAPAVWMLWAMVANRWLFAGVMFGVAAAMKPQAAALLPVWALALVTIRPYAKVVQGGLTAGVTLFLLAIPFSLHSGAAWWKQSYQANLFEHSRGLTTLMAFNVWYLDCLLTGSVDETVRWFGVTKAAWGQVGLGLALVVGFGWMARRRVGDSRGLVVWTALVMIAFVSIPTRVHERFILLILPFLLVCAFFWKRVWPGFIVLVVVATAQVTWPQWVTAASVDWEPFEKEMRQTYDTKVGQMPPAQRATQPPIDEVIRAARSDYEVRVARVKPMEWALTLLGLAGTLLAVIALIRTRSDAG